ncbi:MAG: sigma factor-like helix-turn-helix DNA-binding protein [Minisyncoccia bacterium]
MATKPSNSALFSKKRVSKKPLFENVPLIKNLLSEVSDRAREVLTLRFGLGASGKRETLEAIGERWGITRERVRQIEAAAIEAVRNSKSFKDAKNVFNRLSDYLESLGAIVPEDNLLDDLGGDEKEKNRFRFLLVVGSEFYRERETDEFLARWHVSHSTAKKVHAALSSLYENLSDEEVLSESELFERFLTELRDIDTAYRNEEVLKRWLSLSKTISANPLSEWGRAGAPAIRTKGIRDYAYLVVKRQGAPMHFRDVANIITELFAKKAHVATTHNELMKDQRFVLVGRGLYALSEWGYRPGVVRDVIRDILKKSGPLSREKVLEEVKKVRYVKDNTILVNLNDPKHFKRSKDGIYSVV